MNGEKGISLFDDEIGSKFNWNISIAIHLESTWSLDEEMPTKLHRNSTNHFGVCFMFFVHHRQMGGRDISDNHESCVGLDLIRSDDSR